MIILNLYKHFLLFFDDLKEGILKKIGNKHRPIGYNKDNTKEINVSFIRWICVFL